LGVISYGKYNWVRLWMLGESPKAVDARLVATGSLNRYIAFMRDALSSLHPAVRDDGYLCLMIGDVRDRSTGEVTNLAEEVWRQAAADLDWHRVGVIADRLPSEHKVSRIWKNAPGRATKTDRILVLSRRKASSKHLPSLERIRWTPPTAWA
jgi:site-specific DNA-methyltransferase (adenine-specific)